MKLPNASFAINPEQKISLYLLNESHSLGAAKAAFFKSFGFSKNAPELLVSALRLHATVHEISLWVSTLHGIKHELAGLMPSPNGSEPNVKTVWIILDGETVPRFVTAVPN